MRQIQPRSNDRLRVDLAVDDGLDAITAADKAVLGLVMPDEGILAAMTGDHEFSGFQLGLFTHGGSDQCTRRSPHIGSSRINERVRVATYAWVLGRTSHSRRRRTRRSRLCFGISGNIACSSRYLLG